MDEAGIEQRGLSTLKPWIARIDHIQNRSQLIALMMTPGFASPVRIAISSDAEDPTRYVADTGQAKLQSADARLLLDVQRPCRL